jgi:hypothetical protein
MTDTWREVIIPERFQITGSLQKDKGRILEFLATLAAKYMKSGFRP